MFSHNLRQIVKEKTRVAVHFETLLDLVFLSSRVAHNTLLVAEGISDHKLISVNIQLDAKPQKRPFIPVKIKNFARADDTSILDYLELSLHEFELASASESVEELCHRFKSIVKYCTDKFVPTRTKKTKQCSPWITRDILHIKRKIKRTRKRQTNSVAIVHLREQLKTALKESKRKFYTETLADFIKASPQKFWLHLKDKREEIEHIRIGSEIVTQKSEIARYFNQFIQSVFTKDETDQVDADQACACACAMDPFGIMQEGVFSQLRGLDIKKANGPDEIPSEFLRRYAEWVSFYLTILFRKSVETSSLPQDWRTAIVKPIFKAGNRIDLNNYRPVSLTSVCCKIIEHLLARHIIIFLRKIGTYGTKK